ncbi:hypothetical protein [Spartinivicinus ruber]|uniref:hypothetical protein n=1 Tax=Spartinivicinus ruber TaxID=2683272 RepID=UPI0013D03B97|nr:hypothetical protein [Spartinivicinus ruber]
MNESDVGLCPEKCCSNETVKVLQYIEQYKSLLKENFIVNSSNIQLDFFSWACLVVRSAVRLLAFYNLPEKHFEEVLLLSLKSVKLSTSKQTANVEMVF